MAGLVIAIAQRKGGAGKTTLAAQLAVAWARQGRLVAALDIDPQGSLATWAELRQAARGGEIGFEFAALPGWRAEQWIADRARTADIVVVDTPPHAETEARIVLRAAGLVLGAGSALAARSVGDAGDAGHGSGRKPADARGPHPGAAALRARRQYRRRTRRGRDTARRRSDRQPRRTGSVDGAGAGRARNPGRRDRPPPKLQPSPPK